MGATHEVLKGSVHLWLFKVVTIVDRTPKFQAKRNQPFSCEWCRGLCFHPKLPRFGSNDALQVISRMIVPGPAGLEYAGLFIYDYHQ